MAVYWNKQPIHFPVSNKSYFDSTLTEWYGMATDTVVYNIFAHKVSWGSGHSLVRGAFICANDAVGTVAGMVEFSVSLVSGLSFSRLRL